MYYCTNDIAYFIEKITELMITLVNPMKENLDLLVQIERIFRSSKPVKAMEILVEKQLFPIIFKPPPELEIILPDGIDRSSPLVGIFLSLDYSW